MFPLKNLARQGFKMFLKDVVISKTAFIRISIEILLDFVEEMPPSS